MINFTVLDNAGQKCGLLTVEICPDFECMDKKMKFSSCAHDAASKDMPNPSSYGFDWFQKQIATSTIYPIAIAVNAKQGR